MYIRDTRLSVRKKRGGKNKKKGEGGENSFWLKKFKRIFLNNNVVNLLTVDHLMRTFVEYKMQL